MRLSPELQLSFMEFGDPDGAPAVYFHGWPSSCVEARPLHAASLKAGLRVFALNRPGYGATTPLRLRHFSDWADSVEVFADRIGLKQFQIIAMSGGTPYALACAHRLKSRIISLHVVSGLGPVSDPKVRKSLSPGIRGLLAIGLFLPFVGRAGLALAGKIVQFLPWLPSRMTQYDPLLTPSDRATLRSTVNHDLMNQIAAMAFQNGSFGAYQDGYFYSRPWNFSLASIDIPCRFWHGENDRITSVQMIERMAGGIPDAQVQLFPGDGHFSTPWSRPQQFIDSVKSLS